MRGYTDQVVRLRAGQGETDPYSDEPAQDWDHPDRARIVRSLWEPGPSSEDLAARRDPTTATATLTSLGYPDIRAGDRIERDGEVWQVRGRPRRWPRPRPHTTTRLELKKG